METEFLRTFVLVAETGSMAEAARRLDLSSTSVAQQLRVLEKEFGAALLARAGRTVQLTDAGHQLLQGVRGVLDNLGTLREAVSSGGPVASLRLGTIYTALHSIVPDMLVRLVKAHPDLSVLLRHETSIDLYDAVLRGEVDAAICIHPQFTLPKIFGWRSLRKEPLVVVAPARLGRQDPDELLRTLPLIRYARTQWGGKQAERYLRLAGIKPKERFELSSLTAIAMMVDKGLGVSLVPDAEIPFAQSFKIAKIPLDTPFEERHVGFLWLRASPKQRLVKMLIDAL